MKNENMFKIGLALSHIAMAVDDETLKKIKPYLEEIEQTIISDNEEGDDRK